VTAVIINPTGDGRHSVRFKYDPTVVATIKHTVPGYARAWSAHTRCWFIDPDWSHVLAAELRRHGHTVTGVDEPPPRQVHHNDANWAHALFRRCGSARTEPVFKALTRVLHPDVAITGDTTLMRELIDARNELSTEKGTTT
jgi:hypothetical protein